MTTDKETEIIRTINNFKNNPLFNDWSNLLEKNYMYSLPDMQNICHREQGAFILSLTKENKFWLMFYDNFGKEEKRIEKEYKDGHLYETVSFQYSDKDQKRLKEHQEYFKDRILEIIPSEEIFSNPHTLFYALCLSESIENRIFDKIFSCIKNICQCLGLIIWFSIALLILPFKEIYHYSLRKKFIKQLSFYRFQFCETLNKPYDLNGSWQYNIKDFYHDDKQKPLKELWIVGGFLLIYIICELLYYFKWIPIL